MNSLAVDATRVVAIGVNKIEATDLPTLHCAAHDARAVAEEFQHPERGVALRENVALLTRSTETHGSAVLDLLRQHSDACGPHDLLVVYFAGHGVSDRSNLIYLGTPDLRVEPTGKVRLHTGIALTDLIQHVFQPCKGRSLLILDSCFSGNYLEEEARRRRVAARAESTFEAELADLDRHYAILSCKPDAASREDRLKGHGWFTQHMLRALRGEDPAYINRSGELTASRLYDFVLEESEQQPPIDKPCADRHRIVLSRVTAPTAAPTLPRQSDAQAPAQWFVKPLPNPLENAVKMSADLARLAAMAMHDADLDGDREPALIQMLTAATRARSARLLRHRPTQTRREHARRQPSGPLTSDDDQVLSMLSSRLASGGHRAASGFALSASNMRGTATLAIPTAVRSSHDFDVVLLAGLPPQSPWETDIGATLLQAAFSHVANADTPDPIAAEACLLDAMRATFGRVPSNMYERRFALLRDQLKVQTFVFEPIVHIGIAPRDVYVASWEALARDPDLPRCAPKALFDSAELWGTRFIIELDSVFVQSALDGYSNAHNRSGLNSRLQPISVNVYPDSVASEAYFKAIQQALTETGIPASSVVLELSEKRPLPELDGTGRVAGFDYFRNVLEEFVGRLPGVSFAIDDFGVGHSSIDRLARLKLAHVKIDRDLLFHDTTMVEIAMVCDMTRQIGLAANKIVIEGFNDDCPVSLKQLHDEAKIEYVQGYWFPLAEPYLNEFPDEYRAEVADDVRNGRPPLH